MPYWNLGPSQSEPFAAFAGGIDLDSPLTMTPPGSYVDAQNMLLYSPTSGQHMKTCQLDGLLDSAVTWPTGTMLWVQPFTYNSYNSGTGVFTANTHLVTHRTGGVFHRYDVGTPGTNTVVRRLPGNTSVVLTQSFTYDTWLIVCNGRDAVWKYGQHFLWSGVNEATPYMFPLGSKPISAVDSGFSDESTAHGAGGSYVADASAPDGGARVGTHCLKVAAGTTTTVTFTTVRNLQSGPVPYGGTNFGASDFVQMQYLKAAKDATANNLQLIFEDNVGQTMTFTLAAASQTADNTWQNTASNFIISSGVDSGTFSWAIVKKYKITNNDAVNDVYIDDLYMLYALAPPAGGLGTSHKGRVVLGGVPSTGADAEPAYSTVFYSDADAPDEFPTANNQIVTGGSASLARTNQITAMREYGDGVIVGTGQAIFTWTIGETGTPSLTTVTTEMGIDSQRALVETPSGSLMFPWQRGIYLLRQTGRAYVSERVAPFLRFLDLTAPYYTVAIRDELTKTIRWWYRSWDQDLDVSQPSANDETLIYDYVRAQDAGQACWVSRGTQYADYACDVYINGVRQVVYCRFGESDLYVLGDTPGGNMINFVTLPWLSREVKDHLNKWLGVAVSYSSTCNVRVFVRYANHPGEFDTAQWHEYQSLPASPGIGSTYRMPFGQLSRFAQVKFQAQEFGFELFPPVTYYDATTQRGQ